jgi:hypothetical protein
MAGKEVATPPHLEVVSEAKSKREIENLNKKAKELRLALQDLHRPAIEALDNYSPKRPHWRAEMIDDLFFLMAKTTLARVGSLPRNAGRGAKPRRQAKKIASSVATHYFRITGKFPTVITPSDGGKAYGPFLDLLSEVFRLLNVKASAESQAKEAIQRMETIRLKKAI